jgi:hypothetical protein
MDSKSTYFEITKLCEVFITSVEFAWIRFNTGVDNFVGAQVASLSKTFAANLAWEAFFATVAIHMCL